METYERTTRPLIDFYSALGLLVPVAAMGSRSARGASRLWRLEAKLITVPLRARNRRTMMTEEKE